MKREEIKQMLIILIGDLMYIPIDDINEDSSFKYNLDFDSFDDVELIVNAENEFGIQIPDDLVENVITVKDAIDLIEKSTK